MSNTVIKIENVSKMYRLGEVGTGTLTHDLHRAWAKLTGKPDPFAQVGVSNDREQKGGEYVWALKDINLEVKEGEILGIIGRNGAGKSTLLKLLSRVTAPTTGRILTKGRIASLLEVGTGFHPELTGRENIYLNGTILGMTRREITKQLEEIIEFSGCAKYIDTPVKRYSSGMQVRLGFAVAAHLECEILIVDEVLAVGDAEFQKKCMEKMDCLSQEYGKTILFVSHNLTAVRGLCSHGSIINNGKLSLSSDIDSSINYYIDMSSSDWQSNTPNSNRKGTGEALISDIKTLSKNKAIYCGEDFSIEFTVTCQREVLNPLFYFGIFDQFKNEISHINTRMTNAKTKITSEENKIKIDIIKPQLSPGKYKIHLGILENNEILDLIEDGFILNIEEADYYSSGYLGVATKGIILLPHKWSISGKQSLSVE